MVSFEDREVKITARVGPRSLKPDVHFWMHPRIPLFEGEGRDFKKKECNTGRLEDFEDRERSGARGLFLLTRRTKKS